MDADRAAPVPVVSVRPGDVHTVAAGQDVLAGKGRQGFWGRLWPFLGPAFVACVAYIDPGNFATNIQGGAQFGYTLVWVIVASNLMAMLIQTLSAKLGIASGRNLAELCREHYPRGLVWLMWGLMEVVAMATDLAEFLGAALGFYLLFGMPLWIAGLVTAVATFLILGLERYGFRPLEAVITALVGVVGVCYLIETLLAPPEWGQVAAGLVPRFDPEKTTESVLLAAGILGATVMPHVIFLHSALTQGRIITRDPAQMRRLLRYEMLDVIVALGLAGLINAAMLIMAATTFYLQNRTTDVVSIETAYETLAVFLGPAAKYVFGISLLASGLSSSAVGTLSGQVIMQGFLNFHIPIWVRRLATMAPALIVIFIGLDPTRTLVISQVVLSFGLPFAVIPLVTFTSRRQLMGPLVNHAVTAAAAWLIGALILALNFYLLYQTFAGA
jgi:manganese transport protein